MNEFVAQESQYKLDNVLGAGGLGKVYKAYKMGASGFSKPVAIKFLQSSLVDKQHDSNSLMSEANIVAQLNHPGIVQVLELGSSDGSSFMVMELVEGYTLNKVLQLHLKPLPLSVALSIVLEVANALLYIHEICMAYDNKKIIHTDVSLQNIMVHKNSLVTKLNDFGFAKILNKNDSLAVGDQIIGNPYYISPEHSLGEWVDQRSDIYSLGVIFYDLILNCRQFDEPILSITEKARDGKSIDRRRLDGIQSNVSAVIQKMLSIDANDRFQSTSELVEALEGLTVILPDYPNLLQTKRHVFEVVNQQAQKEKLTASALGEIEADQSNAKTTENFKTRVLPSPPKATASKTSNATLALTYPVDQSKTGPIQKPTPSVKTQKLAEKSTLFPRKRILILSLTGAALAVFLLTFAYNWYSRSSASKHSRVLPAESSVVPPPDVDAQLSQSPPEPRSGEPVQNEPQIQEAGAVAEPEEAAEGVKPIVTISAKPCGRVKIVKTTEPALTKSDFGVTPLRVQLGEGTYKITITHPRFGSKAFDLIISGDQTEYKLEHTF